MKVSGICAFFFVMNSRAEILSKSTYCKFPRTTRKPSDSESASKASLALNNQYLEKLMAFLLKIACPSIITSMRFLYIRHI